MVNEEHIRKRILWHMEVAKKEIRQTIPSADRDTTVLHPAVIGVWEHGEREMRLGFHNDYEKEIWGLAIAATAKRTHVKAIIVRIATTQLRMDLVKKELGIAPDSPFNMDDDYGKIIVPWIKSKTGGFPRIGLLPPEYTTDCMTVFSIGPRLPNLTLNQPFEFLDGAWSFPRHPIICDIRTGYVISVVPKWWDG